MRELVSYSCTACGGALTVDKSQEVYECPFCGNAYDFVQMHHDELLNDAAVNMRQMEFVSAKEKFNSILEKDPHDFEALRGRILCAGKWKTLTEVDTESKMSNVRFDSILERVDEAVEHTEDEETKEFFTDLRKLIELLAQIQKKNIEMKPLEGRIDKLKEKREEVFEDTETETHFAENAVNSALYKADADRSRLMQSRNRFFDEFKALRTKLISVENKLKLDVRPVLAGD